MDSSHSASPSLSEDEGALLFYSSESSSEDGSSDPVWHDEDARINFEDVLGPEDGEGEVNDVNELGYSEL